MAKDRNRKEKDRKPVQKSEPEFMSGLVALALDPLQLPGVMKVTVKAYQAFDAWMTNAWTGSLVIVLLTLLGVGGALGMMMPGAGVVDFGFAGVDEAASTAILIIGLELARRVFGFKQTAFQWVLENVMPKIPQQALVWAGVILTALSRGVDFSTIFPAFEFLDILTSVMLVGPLLLLGTLELNRKHEEAKKLEEEAEKGRNWSPVTPDVIVSSEYKEKHRNPANTQSESQALGLPRTED